MFSTGITQITKEYRENIYFVIDKHLEKVNLSQWGAGEYKVINVLPNKFILYVPFATYRAIEKAIVVTRFAKKQDKIIEKTVIGYIAYGRQERETTNEPELLSPLFNLICSELLNIEFIEPHKIPNSNQYIIKSALTVFNNQLDHTNPNVKIVAPDKGSKAKYDELGIKADITINKKRVDGKVLSEIGEDLIKQDVDSEFEFHILDDICDGGRTFTNIAKLLKAKYPNSTVILHVAHAIIPFGIKLLQKNGIDRLECLDTCIPVSESTDFVKSNSVL